MDHRRIDAGLAAILDDTAGEQGLGLLIARPGHQPPWLSFFVDLVDDARQASLPQGVELGGSGRVRTASATLEDLERLSEAPGVRRLVAARRLRPHMDVAAKRAGVVTFRQRTGASGRGVVLGIVDTGIETDHPSFAGRILRLWDQTLSGPGVAEGAYGMELAADMRHLSVDAVGHGTYVAGIAGGDDVTYGGVAPGAELVVVKTDFLDVHVADGLRYIFRVADELGRPAVVVLAAGSADDPHDGSDAFSAIVDAESGPGRVVCCSAGNEGQANVHAHLALSAGAHTTIACAIPTFPATQPLSARFSGWYSGADQVAVAVVSPTGLQSPFQSVVTDGPPTRLYQVPGGDVRIVTPGPDPATGDHAFLVEVSASSPTGPPPITSGWGLRLRGDQVEDGRVDVWALDGAVAQFSGPHVQHSAKVGAPAAASQAVAVGAYTTKVAWSNLVGHGHEAGFAVDDLARFSSQGPGRDGSHKPDLVAPGAMVAAALSAQSPFHVPYLMDNFNLLGAGTSAAAALVGGLVALLLEQEPTLGPDQVKAHLRAHCQIPGRDPGQFDPAWGYGLIDAEGLLAEAAR